MTMSELTSAFEAVLFSGGEPQSIDRFSQVFDITPEKVVKVMEALKKKLNEQKSGLELLRLDNTYQLATKAEYADYIKKMFDIRRRTPLSPAALEVLAVVAYNQPVTKSFIEQVRGVDSTYAVTTLCEKQLVEVVGRLDVPGKPNLYATTETFLRCFGLSSLDELPKTEVLESTSESEAEENTENAENAENTVNA